MAGVAAISGASESADVEDRSQLKIRDRAHELIFRDLKAMADH